MKSNIISIAYYSTLGLCSAKTHLLLSETTDQLKEKDIKLLERMLEEFTTIKQGYNLSKQLIHISYNSLNYLKDYNRFKKLQVDSNPSTLDTHIYNIEKILSENKITDDAKETAEYCSKIRKSCALIHNSLILGQ